MSLQSYEQKVTIIRIFLDENLENNLGYKLIEESYNFIVISVVDGISAIYKDCYELIGNHPVA